MKTFKKVLSAWILFYFPPRRVETFAVIQKNLMWLKVVIRIMKQAISWCWLDGKNWVNEERELIIKEKSEMTFLVL